MVLDGAMNGAAFKAYTEQCLAPSLEPGDIVIMDNLSSHKVAGIREAITAVGAYLLYLPPYSPISIPSSKPSQSSRLASDRSPREPSMTSGRPSPRSSNISRLRNARTTSGTQAMDSIKLEIL